MKKLDVKVVASDNTKLIEALYQQPQIQQALAEGKLKPEDIQRYPQHLTDWIESLNEENDGKMLSSGLVLKPGYYIDIDFEDILVPIIKPRPKTLKRQQELQYLKNYLVRDFPETLLDKRFDCINFDQENDDYLAVVAQLANWQGSDKGYYLYGSLGIGKTYLAACLTNEAASLGKSVAFVHVPSFAQRMRSIAIDKDAVGSEMNKLSRCSLLVLDDIGAETVTSWFRDEVLLPILNYRMEAHKLTVFTSNYSMDELEIHLSFLRNGQQESLNARRIMERIRSLAKEVEMTGISRRNLY